MDRFRRPRPLQVVAAVVGFCALAPAASARADTTVFTSTGAEQTFTVPTGVTGLHVVVVGGHGGAGGAADPVPGGLGAVATADIAVSPGQVLYVEVGGNGASDSSGGHSVGGFNGGGDGGAPAASDAAGSGGGASICAPLRAALPTSHRATGDSGGRWRWRWRFVPARPAGSRRRWGRGRRWWQRPRRRHLQRLLRGRRWRCRHRERGRHGGRRLYFRKRGRARNWGPGGQHQRTERQRRHGRQRRRRRRRGSVRRRRRRSRPISRLRRRRRGRRRRRLERLRHAARATPRSRPTRAERRR